MKKFRRFTIVSDPKFRGLGVNSLNEGQYWLHTITLFIVVICFTTRIRRGELYPAKFINGITANIGPITYTIEYPGDVHQLNKVYYRNKLNTILASRTFHQFTHDKWALYNEVDGQWMVLDSHDVYIFNPNMKVEGYVSGNTFYAVKELSVG